MRVYSPSPISLFFAPYIRDDFESGAIGGGFTIDKGTYVEIREKGEGIKVYINNEEVRNSLSEYVARKMMEKTGIEMGLEIQQTIEAPIGYGFGTSAASALTTAVGVSKIIGVEYTLVDLAMIAHEAELRFKTGLGSVCGLVNPGIAIVRRPGSPYNCLVDHIVPPDEDIYIISTWFRPIKTSIALSRKDIEEIKRVGDETLSRILRRPTLENMMSEAWRFAQSTPFVTDKIRRIIDDLRDIKGIIGATQTMIGEAVVVATYKDMIEEVSSRLSKYSRNILISKVDYKGVKIL